VIVGAVPSAKGYLSWPAMLMACLDGIKTKIEPAHTVDQNTHEMKKDELPENPRVPASREESSNALEADHDLPMEGGVFSQGFIDSWISWKRETEIDELRLRPHPHEFALYYDCQRLP